MAQSGGEDSIRLWDWKVEQRAWALEAMQSSWSKEAPFLFHCSSDCRTRHTSGGTPHKQVIVMQAEVLDSVDPHGKAPVLVGGGEDWFLKGGDAC